MKKFAVYSIAWAIVLGLFNLVAFITPAKDPAIGKYTASFFIAYGAITLAFILNLICTLVLFRSKNYTKSFYRTPLVLISFTALFVMLPVGAVFMWLPALPYWIGIIVCYAVLGANIIAIIKAASTVALVSGTDHDMEILTAFIKTAAASAGLLVKELTDPILRESAVKVYEALRYSDPVSDPALIKTEREISAHYDTFADAARAGDTELATTTLPALLSAIDLRNAQAKTVK